MKALSWTIIALTSLFIDASKVLADASGDREISLEAAEAVARGAAFARSPYLLPVLDETDFISPTTYEGEPAWLVELANAGGNCLIDVVVSKADGDVLHAGAWECEGEAVDHQTVSSPNGYDYSAQNAVHVARGYGFALGGYPVLDERDDVNLVERAGRQVWHIELSNEEGDCSLVVDITADTGDVLQPTSWACPDRQ